MALEGTDVPHPVVVAACGDVEVIGGLLPDGAGRRVQRGRAPEPCRDEAYRSHLGVALADGIGALSSVDPFACGLGDLGKPERWLERQVERWRGQLDSYRGLPGYDGPDIPGIDELGDWVEANRPSDWAPGLIHGDYSFANVMLRRDVPRLAAIIDWELTTIGDPLPTSGTCSPTGRMRAGKDAFDIQAGQVGDAPGHRPVPAERTGAMRPASTGTGPACFRLPPSWRARTPARGDLAPKDVGDRLHRLVAPGPAQARHHADGRAGVTAQGLGSAPGAIRRRSRLVGEHLRFHTEAASPSTDSTCPVPAALRRTGRGRRRRCPPAASDRAGSRCPLLREGASCRTSAVMPLSTIPGATALTRMPACASSSAATTVSMLTPAFAAL